MREKRLFAVLVVTLSAAVVSAQSLTEKVDVTLVNVDVTVSTHGAPARGLTRGDFEVLEDGVPQSITNFYAIENARERGAAAAPEKGTTSPRVDERFRRKVLVAIDNRHVSVHSRDVALRRIEQFVDEHFESGAYDWSVAMITDRAHTLLPLTSDKQRIHDTLAQIRRVAAGGALREQFDVDDRIARLPGSPDPVGSVTAATLDAIVARSNTLQHSYDTAHTYVAIADLARAFASTEGRKIVLLVTGDFDDQETLLTTDRALSAETSATAQTLRDWLIREANVSQVSFYVVNSEGLTPGNVGAEIGGPTGPNYNGAAFEQIGSNRSSNGGSLLWLANETGGKALMGNFLDRSLRDFDVASANFYSLAYRPDHPDDTRYHAITVRLKTPREYTLTYRRGYSTLPSDARLDRAMTSATAAEMQPSTLPLQLTTGTVQPGGTRDAVLVPIYATVPAKDLQFLPAAGGPVARVDFWVSVFDEKGRLITKFRTVREAHASSGTEGSGAFVETHAVRLRRNQPYRLVVAMRDQVTDAVGIHSTTVRF